jgi:hypothetical protein
MGEKDDCGISLRGKEAFNLWESAQRLKYHPSYDDSLTD